MSDVFCYTFRTNKFVKQIEDVLGQEVFVVDRPSKDFEALCVAIKSSGKQSVLGIGMTKGASRQEKFCYNRFGSSKIDKLALEHNVRLEVPLGDLFEEGEGMTYGFCNYVAFRLKNSLCIPSGFLHLNVEDIGKLSEL